MRRWVWALLLCLAAGPAFGQNTQSIYEYRHALTDSWHFGAPRYTTVLLPACDANNDGGLAFDTTLLSLVICNGTAWAAAGSDVTADYNWTGTNTWLDNKWFLLDNTTTTKRLAFELSGITAANTRTVTIPDSNTTLPIFSQIITFSGPTAARTVTLPDAAFTVLNNTMSNLGTTALNLPLLPDAAAADDFGSATLPFKDIYIAGSSGTPGTNNFRFTGASTSGTRVITLPDWSLAFDYPSNGSVTIGSTAGDSSAAVDVDNVFLGAAAGTAASGTSTDNTCVGDNACDSLTTGDQNVVIGADANLVAATDSGVVVIGYGAFATEGGVSIGRQAGDSQSSGSVDNVLIGDQAATALTGTATDNVCIGDLSCALMTGGDQNVVVGADAGGTIQSSSRNALFGFNAESADANDQVGIGYFAVTWAASGVAIGSSAETSDGVSIGYIAGDAQAAADVDNVFVGNTAGSAANGTSTDNTCLGDNACDSLTTGDQNVVIGADADLVGATDSAAIVIGYGAKGGNTGGLTIGAGAGAALVAGADRDVLIGTNAGAALNNASSDDNTCLGSSACASVTTGTTITAVGSGAASTTIATGSLDVFIGYNAGLGIISNAVSDVIIGASAGPSIDNHYNTCIGYASCQDVDTSNTCVGQACLGGDGTNTLDYNSAFGGGAGNSLSDDSDSNICIGYESCSVAAAGSLVRDNTTTLMNNVDPKNDASMLLGFGSQEAMFVQGTPKALTESTATAIVRISVAQGSYTGIVVHWRVVATDATDFQSLSGETVVDVVNKAGAETCVIRTLPAFGSAVEAASAGTLALEADPTCVSNAADTVDVLLDAVSSLAQTTLSAYYTVFVNGPATVMTPQ